MPSHAAPHAAPAPYMLPLACCPSRCPSYAPPHAPPHTSLLACCLPCWSSPPHCHCTYVCPCAPNMDCWGCRLQGLCKHRALCSRCMALPRARMAFAMMRRLGGCFISASHGWGAQGSWGAGHRGHGGRTGYTSTRLWQAASHSMQGGGTVCVLGIQVGGLCGMHAHVARPIDLAALGSSLSWPPREDLTLLTPAGPNPTLPYRTCTGRRTSSGSRWPELGVW